MRCSCRWCALTSSAGRSRVALVIAAASGLLAVAACTRAKAAITPDPPVWRVEFSAWVAAADGIWQPMHWTVGNERGEWAFVVDPNSGYVRVAHLLDSDNADVPVEIKVPVDGVAHRGVVEADRAGGGGTIRVFEDQRLAGSGRA